LGQGGPQFAAIDTRDVADRTIDAIPVERQRLANGRHGRRDPIDLLVVSRERRQSNRLGIRVEPIDRRRLNPIVESQPLIVAESFRQIDLHVVDWPRERLCLLSQEDARNRVNCPADEWPHDGMPDDQLQREFDRMILSRHRKRDDRGSKAQNATARPAPGAAQEPRRGDAPQGILESGTMPVE
jgi:hypothetical protein